MLPRWCRPPSWSTRCGRPDPPADPINALQSLISRVRRVLGAPDSIQQVADGYRLAVDRGCGGRRRLRRSGCRRSAGAGGRIADQTARDTLAKALGAVAGHSADRCRRRRLTRVAPTARLVEQRLDAQADRIEAELRLGRAGDVIGDLEDLVAAHPLRERLAGQLMRALAATGRTADALAVYERLRARLADELGVDPGAELRRCNWPCCAARSKRSSSPRRRRRHRRRSNLRASLTSFIGREAEVARVSELLDQGRLVTVVGPGGAGKTRLANEIARQWISAAGRRGVAGRTGSGHRRAGHPAGDARRARSAGHQGG